MIIQRVKKIYIFIREFYAGVNIRIFPCRYVFDIVPGIIAVYSMQVSQVNSFVVADARDVAAHFGDDAACAQKRARLIRHLGDISSFQDGDHLPFCGAKCAPSY